MRPHAKAPRARREVAERESVVRQRMGGAMLRRSRSNIYASTAGALIVGQQVGGCRAPRRAGARHAVAHPLRRAPAQRRKRPSILHARRGDDGAELKSVRLVACLDQVGVGPT